MLDFIGLTIKDVITKTTNESLLAFYCVYNRLKPKQIASWRAFGSTFNVSIVNSAGGKITSIV